MPGDGRDSQGPCRSVPSGCHSHGYQGGYHSLIQANLDLPIAIDRAIDLACHEGYPGHHVYNACSSHSEQSEGGMRLLMAPSLRSG